MVIQEPKSAEFKSLDLENKMAHPIDRIAAFLVDAGLLFLTSSLLVAPFQKRLKSAQMLSEHNEVIFWILAILTVAGLVSALYQFVSIAFYSATPGKKVFGLQVVDIWSGKKPGVFASFVRGTLWWLDTVAGCLPHMALYSDRLRRPLHDRIANTMVISNRGRHGQPPLKNEQTMVTAMFISFYVLGFSVVFHETRSLYEALKFDDTMSVLEALSPSYCEDVSERQSSWPTEAGKIAPRVSIAMALFAASKIEESCLDQEAYIELRNGENLELAYLARAFANSDESELSDKYLQKVCEADSGSEACEFSKLIDLWTQREWDAASFGFEKLLPHASLFVKIWAIKHFEKVKDFSTELQVINSAWPIGPLSDFMAAHRTVALWGMDRPSEAVVSATAAVEALPAAKRVGLSSWMCFRQSLNCEGVDSQFCEITEKEHAEGLSLDHELTILSLARVYSCKGDESSLQTLKLEAEGAAHNVLLAMELNKAGKSSEAVEVLYDLIEKTEEGTVTHHEALRLLAQWSTKQEDLRAWASEWLAKARVDQFDMAELGKVYQKRLKDFNEVELAKQIASRIDSEKSGSRMPASQDRGEE